MTAKKTADKKSADRTEAELVAELRHLRAVSKSVAESFVLRCEADIETVLSGLSRIPSATLRRKQTEWGKLLKGLKVKPEKGRLQDLKKLHNLVELLLADVLEESERKPRKKKAPQVAPAVDHGVELDSQPVVTVT